MTTLRQRPSKKRTAGTRANAKKPSSSGLRGTKYVRAAARLVRKLYQPALDELAK